MKKFPIIFFLVLFLCSGLASCLTKNDDIWDDYEAWRKTNESWILEQANKKDENGNDYYKKVVPAWNKNAYVYIHYFNDTMLTRDNLSPLYTSTVDVKYIGRFYDGAAFDSSYLSTSPADSIFRTRLTDVIHGWTIALTDMHVGDSCQVLIPYQYAYGENQTGSIPPYSALQFDIKLVDIPGFEIQP